jgi:hypothetical protein
MLVIAKFPMQRLIIFLARKVVQTRYAFDMPNSHSRTLKAE